MILSVCLMASLAVVACKPDGDNKKDNGNEQKPDDGKKPDEEEFKMEVAIDGNFAEWDKLTDETADGAYYIYEENACDTLSGLLRVKLTSDEDYIYVYTEINFADIAQGAGPFGQGGSWIGFSGTSPKTPGALFVYVGADDDASGAYAARSIGEKESMWSYTGFDAFPQFYFALDQSDGKVKFGWNQNNWPQNRDDWKEDEWGKPLSDHGRGWWGSTADEGTPAVDNTVCDENTFKFSEPMKIVDPVTKKEVLAVKAEFSMDRGTILESNDKINKQAVIGVFYEQRGDAPQQTHAVGSAKIPSGDTPITLKLK